MEIKHKIISFNYDVGGITVLYYTDEFPEGYFFNIDFPIENGNYPSEEEVQSLIEFYKPKGQIERILLVKNTEVPNYDFLTDIENDRNLNKPVIDSPLVVLLRNELLTHTDYTQLSDADLSDSERIAWKNYRQQLRDITNQEGFPENTVFPVPPSSNNVHIQASYERINYLFGE